MSIDDQLHENEPLSDGSIEAEFQAAYEVLSQNGAIMGLQSTRYGALWVRAGLLRVRQIEQELARTKDEEKAVQALRAFQENCSDELYTIHRRTDELVSEIGGMEAQPDGQLMSEGLTAELTREEEILLRATLVRLGLLDPTATLPKPDDFFSGVGGKSRVFLLFVAGEGVGRRLIAKFDEQRRSANEWQAISSLRLLDTPAETILPHAKNEESDGVIIFPVAHAHGLKRFVPCAQFLRDTLAVAPYNGSCCLRLALEPLQAFYDIQPGLIVDRNALGEPLTWGMFFNRLPTEEQLRKLAERAWLEVAWDGDFLELPGNEEPLPNPLRDVNCRIQERTGDILLSRTHGDLNLTNVLVWPDGDQTPLKVNIIDLATSKEEQVTASDLAQLEIALWDEVFFDGPDTALAGEGLLLAEFAKIIATLDGRQPEYPKFQTKMGEGVACLTYQLRRWACRVLAPSPHRCYLLGDYYHCLYFRWLVMLKFVLEDPVPHRARAAFLGAALSLRAIIDQSHGAYSGGAMAPLLMPTREMPEFERLIGKHA